MAMETERMVYKTFPIDKLIQHPKHDFIYDHAKEDYFLSELEKRIIERGLKNPLVVNENGIVISGSRRLAILKKTGYTEVKCKVQKYKNEFEELWDLVIYNLNRNPKTRVQKVREGMILFDILKSYGKNILIEELKYRQRISEKINVDNETRFIVAQIIGMEGGEKSNGKIFSMAKSALEKADEYKAKGNDYYYDMIITQLNKVSSKAAYSLAYKVDIEKLSSVAKKGLLNGQIKGTSTNLPLKTEHTKQIKKCSDINEHYSSTENKEKIKEIVREYNAQSRGEIEIIIPEKEKGYIPKKIEKAMINFRNEIAQCMVHQKDISNLDEEERKKLNKIMNKFIDDFQKDKNIITGGIQE